MQLVRHDASFKILTYAPSNATVDTLAERLTSAGLTAEQLLCLKAPSKSVPEDVRAFHAFLKPAKLRAYRFVLTTCSSAALLQGLEIRAEHFSHMVIDPLAGSKLLQHAKGLFTLELLSIAGTPKFHPEHLVAQLARMAQLEHLVIHLRTAFPNHPLNWTLSGIARHMLPFPASSSPPLCRLPQPPSRVDALCYVCAQRHLLMGCDYLGKR